MCSITRLTQAIPSKLHRFLCLVSFSYFFLLLVQCSTHTTILWFSGFCPGQPSWAGTIRNIHPLTPIVVISHPLSASSIYYDPWHPPCSIYVPKSLFPQSLSKFSLVYPLAWHSPLHAYCPVHFFTQSLPSFHSTCPYHRNMFCCRTEIKVSLYTLYLELYLVA